MYQNLIKKYDITKEDIKEAVNQINFGKIACDGLTLVALVDLCANGDIDKDRDVESVKNLIGDAIDLLRETQGDTHEDIKNIDIAIQKIFEALQNLGG